LASSGHVSASFEDGARELQREVFEAQLAIAERRGLPVILHCVKAFEPTMEILARHPKLPAVIFHGFIGSSQQAARAVEAGYFLSFGERSMASSRTVEAMLSVPAGQIFFETDDSATPIAEIYNRAAEILKMPVDELAKTLYYNYLKVFAK
jgi:TatD DNase family protein